MGDKVLIRSRATPLRVYALDEKNRRRLSPLRHAVPATTVRYYKNQGNVRSDVTNSIKVGRKKAQ